MQRRTAIKQLGILAGGVLLLPHCKGKEVITEASIKLHKLSITGNQETLLASMVESLIPKTDTLGAGELKVHHFVLRMIDDCYEAEDQQKFLLGFAQAEKAMEEKSGKKFEESSLTEQQEFFKALETDKVSIAGDENNLKAFYAPLRELTIQGYLGSEYVLTNLFGYNMVPGRFDGAIEVNAKSDIKTILG